MTYDDLIHLRPQGGFGMVMSDVPWLYRMGKGTGHRAPDRHYECMGLEEIAEIPVSALVSRDCLLWFWTTHPFHEAAYGIVRAWGFTPKTGGEWVKTRADGSIAVGTGYRLRGTGEPYILATRGNPRVAARNIPGSFLAPRREHSRKPDLAYAYAEAMSPGVKRLDLFSRQPRPGWVSFGRQSSMFPTQESA